MADSGVGLCGSAGSDRMTHTIDEMSSSTCSHALVRSCRSWSSLQPTGKNGGQAGGRAGGARKPGFTPQCSLGCAPSRAAALAC